jgi:hypothetical protein
MNSLLLTTALILLLNRYPIQLRPSYKFDFIGRLLNTYQILSHIPFGLKLLGVEKSLSTNIFYPTLFVMSDENYSIKMMDFLIINMIDYIGWIAIFSRIKHVPLSVKSLANAHAATSIICLLDYEAFKNLYLFNTGVYAWDLFRGVFILSDSITRSYYHFYVLGNY